MNSGEAFGAGLHAERELCADLVGEEIERRYIELNGRCAELGLGEGEELRGRLLGCWFALQADL